MKQVKDFWIRPSELGSRISVVDNPAYCCPFCQSNTKMAVHEYGVRWACGCARELPRIHLNAPLDSKKFNCSWCKSFKKTIVPFRLHVKIACITRRSKLPA